MSKKRELTADEISQVERAFQMLNAQERKMFETLSEDKKPEILAHQDLVEAQRKEIVAILRAEPIVYLIYTQSQLEAAFKMVQPAEHWKARINKEIPGQLTTQESNLIAAAVAYFTGSSATFKYLKSKNVTRVTAAGYWAAVGA